ncbi:hypothetical protein [Paracraurococcus lichenis]|uniref:Uncharacterized protein n=1 Tax=Paracraurococcus lichenis TaxID=3064888 RepID=A0ABT9DSD7_9PROT|nr:hypothetical protein [Paracraurococcus sp. LOR1-02]MDO9706791.1 hypothetical protein [Paracraurococcus sp. LOR1-02]
MPRLSLAAIIPPLLAAVVVVLFLHRWTGGPDTPQPAPNTAAYREASGSTATGGSVEPPSASSIPPPAAMNPVPAGTSNVEPPGNPPAAATPRAPSGEPARGQGGG